jgi:predicted HTH transcriptional regulator
MFSFRARERFNAVFAKISFAFEPKPDDVCFKGGYIDSWGRGTLKIINACREAELPEPLIIEQDSGFLV